MAWIRCALDSLFSRLVANLAKIESLRGICRAYIDFTIEIEGQRKPALKGEAQFLYYFE